MALHCDMDGKKADIGFRGNIMDITAEVSIFLNALYSDFAKPSPSLGEMFKYFVTKMVTDPASPTWQKREPQEGDVNIEIQKPNGFTGNQLF